MRLIVPISTFVTREPAQKVGTINRTAGTVNVTGDWDTGIGFHLDGPYINRPDDGSAGVANPYFDADFLSKPRNFAKQSWFAPNRIVTGPGHFGSMPTGVRANAPWRTLLFRPDPEHYGAPNQPEVGGLPDHLYMDLFWMPVIEPYTISMPFATRGKINLLWNYLAPTPTRACPATAAA